MRAFKRTSLTVLVAAICGVGMVLSVGAGDSSVHISRIKKSR